MVICIASGVLDLGIGFLDVYMGIDHLYISEENTWYIGSLLSAERMSELGHEE